MKHFISFFIYIFLAFFYCLGQNGTLAVNHSQLYQKISGKYTKWQGHLTNKKSHLFKFYIQCPNSSPSKTKLNFNLPQNRISTNKTSHKRVHFFVRSGQRLNRALTFSGKNLLQKIPQNLSFMEDVPQTEADRPFFKETFASVKAFEMRTGGLNNIILQNDIRRPNNVISSNIDARLRPHSAINSQTNLFLVGFNILL